LILCGGNHEIFIAGPDETSALRPVWSKTDLHQGQIVIERYAWIKDLCNSNGLQLS
jgi:hypothetical protein